jgi:hypothetical protein
MAKASGMWEKIVVTRVRLNFSNHVAKASGMGRN